MGRYLQAEFYKLFHRNYARLILLAIPLLVVCYLAIMVSVNLRRTYDPWTFHGVMALSSELLPLGFLATLIVCDLVFAGQYRRGTLKNEVSYGIPRSRTYLGKLMAQVVTSVVLCVITVALVVGLSWILFPHEGFPLIDRVPNDQLTARFLLEFLYELAVAFPLFLGVQAAACCLFFLFRYDIAAAGALVFLVEFLDDVIVWFFSVVAPSRAELALAVDRFVDSWLPREVLARVQLGLDFSAWWRGDPTTALESIRQGWLAGVVWFVLFTAIGLAAFRRREIR